MLKTYLTTLPYTKFILIEDRLSEKGVDIFDYVVKCQTRRTNSKIHFLVFQGIISRVKKKYEFATNIRYHDFVSNFGCWTNDSKLHDSNLQLHDLQSVIVTNDVVVLDSLAHAVHLFGLNECYKFLNNLMNVTGVQQIATILHKDLLLDDRCNAYFEHLCTLSVRIKPRFLSENNRLTYRYKKQGGKVIRQVEEYKFDDDNLVTFKVEKPDAAKILSVVSNSVNPENLSTFKIGLTEAEKESKEKVVLPYLPKGEQHSGQGEISYILEEIDDWDEEDPDDDLDI